MSHALGMLLFHLLGGEDAEVNQELFHPLNALAGAPHMPPLPAVQAALGGQAVIGGKGDHAAATDFRRGCCGSGTARFKDRPTNRRMADVK